MHSCTQAKKQQVHQQCVGSNKPNLDSSSYVPLKCVNMQDMHMQTLGDNEIKRAPLLNSGLLGLMYTMYII